MAKGTAVRKRADVDLVCFVEKGRDLRGNLSSFSRNVDVLSRTSQINLVPITNGSRRVLIGRRKSRDWQSKIKRNLFLYNFHNDYLLNLKLVETSGEENYSLPDYYEELDVQK